MYRETTNNPRLPFGYGGCFYGAYAALVTDLEDPDNQGRVKIKLPWSPDGEGLQYEAWARLSTLMAGAERGSWFVPDLDDEVLVIFEGGNPRRPYVIGSLWNGKDAPPETMDAKNSIKAIHSRNGVKIVMDDSDGRETLTLETPGGHKFTLEDGSKSVTLEDSNGNTVTMEPAGVTVESSGKVTVKATQVEISAAMLKVDAAVAQFSGIVQAQTVDTKSVISPLYTTGAGNTT